MGRFAGVTGIVIATALLMLCPGCGGGGSPALQHTQTKPLLGNNPAAGPDELAGKILPPVDTEINIDQGSEGHTGLPAFPGSGGDTFSPVHMVSAAEYQTPGDGFVDSFGANNRAGANAGDYILVPEQGGIAWAMYSIPDLTGDRPVSVEVAVTPAELELGSGEDLPLSYWIGVADYTLFHWDWLGPFINPQEVVINSDKLNDRYVSEDGTLHWVAVLYGDQEGGLPGITLQSGTVVTDPDYYTNNPHYTLVRSITVGGASESSKFSSALEESQHIRIVWNHVEEFGPHDIKNKAFEYKIYRRGPIDLNPKEIDAVPSPGNVYIDDGIGYPLREPPIPAPVPGAEYTYFIQALNPTGYTPLSTPKFGTVPLLPPEIETASDREHLGRINLTWTAAEGADDYLVYRDLQDAPIATTGDVLTWDDDTLDPTDGAEHTYWLRSVNQYVPEGSELFSEPKLGRQDTLPVPGLIGAPLTGLTPLTVGFDAATSHDPDDGTNPGEGVTLYDWDFNGDGIFSNEVGSLPEEDAASDGHPEGSTAQYTYVDDGVFNAAVRVTDEEGNYTMQSVEIVVGNSPPVADLGANPLAGNTPLVVEFDATGSTDANGTVSNYQFDYGEGTGWETPVAVPIVQHTYNSPGNYTAKVQVQDDDDAWSTVPATILVNVNYPPTADLQASTGSGDAPLIVDFDASGSTDEDGTIIDYEWDYDGNGVFNESDNGEDGAQGNSTAQYTYNSSGTFDATVRVTDDAGGEDTASALIIVNIPPTADIQANPTNGIFPLTVDFDATGSTDSDGTVDNYEFDFDEGAGWEDYGTDAEPSHEYTNTEVFRARVRVTDNDGSTDTATVVIGPSEWVHTWGGSETDWGRSVVVDSTGNAFVAGRTDSDGEGGYDAIVAKYNSIGVLQWVKCWGGANNEYIRSLAVDSSGNIYAVGETNSFGGSDIFIIKFSPVGEVVWAKTWSDGRAANSIVLDTGGNLVITGFTAYGGDFFILKMDQSGALVYQKLWDAGFTEIPIGRSVLDASNNLYVTGGHQSPAMILKVNSSGGLVWQKSFFGIGTGVELHGGNLYVCAIIGTEIGLLSLTTSGNRNWFSTWETGNLAECQAVRADSSGNIYVGGYTQDDPVLDMVLLKFNSAGQGVWQKTWDSGGDDNLMGLDITSTGEFYFSGYSMNNSGSWVDANGTFGSSSNQLSNASGTMSDATGTLETAPGVLSSPTGTEDTGGGGNDLLIGKMEL